MFLYNQYTDKYKFNSYNMCCEWKTGELHIDNTQANADM